MKPIPELLRQAVQHHEAGRLAEAEALYRKLLRKQPQDPDALHLLGVLAHQAGQYDAALASMQQALARRPRFPGALSNLGNTLRALGRLEEAETKYRQAIAIQPSFLDAHLNLGNALHDLGRFDEAIQSYRKALALNPGLPEAHGNLGNSLRAQGDLEGAVASYRQATELAPGDAATWLNLALARYHSGDPAGALHPLSQALARHPLHPQGWTLFADALASTTELPVDARLLPTFLALLEQPQVHPGPLSRPILTVLRHLSPLADVMAAAGPGALPLPDAVGTARQLSGLTVFLRVLELAPVIDFEVERLLTRLRGGLVLSALDEPVPPEALPLLASLAIQCFVDEFVFMEEAQETMAVARLQVQVGERLATGAAIPPHWVAVLGAYCALHTLPWAQALLGRDWPAEIQGLLVRQVTEPMVERALRPTIPTLTLVADAVSQAVQAQYEENPYPRWVRTWQHDQPRPLQAVLQSLSPPLALGGWVAPEQPEILIAGCGTGEHAIGTASRFIHGRILAVDLSRASLSYALRKTRERGITTIDYAQADILALGNLDQRFDLIESAGVLHHMADPMAGWRVLAGLLKPGGLMAIALYSEAARQPVVRARARIAQQGWSSSPESMRRFRQTLIQGASEPDLDWLRSTRDFYSLSECRDLLFHIQEHRFTIPGIESALQELGLRFLGFEVPASLWAQFQAFDPDPAATTSLAAWDRFESHHPEAFKGMYQFWCQKI